MRRINHRSYLESRQGNTIIETWPANGRPFLSQGTVSKWPINGRASGRTGRKLPNLSCPAICQSFSRILLFPGPSPVRGASHLACHFSAILDSGPVSHSLAGQPSLNAIATSLEQYETYRCWASKVSRLLVSAASASTYPDAAPLHAKAQSCSVSP